MSDVEINQATIDEWMHDPESPVGKALESKAFHVEATAKVLVSIPGSGRFYPAGEYFLTRGSGPSRKVYHWIRDKDHTASAPGEPPSSEGHLLANIGHRVEIGDGGTIVGRVTANTRYAKWLEGGTRYMEPRPFLRPALAANTG